MNNATELNDVELNEVVGGMDCAVANKVADFLAGIAGVVGSLPGKDAPFNAGYILGIGAGYTKGSCGIP